MFTKYEFTVNQWICRVLLLYQFVTDSCKISHHFARFRNGDNHCSVCKQQSYLLTLAHVRIGIKLPAYEMNVAVLVWLCWPHLLICICRSSGQVSEATSAHRSRAVSVSERQRINRSTNVKAAWLFCISCVQEACIWICTCVTNILIWPTHNWILIQRNYITITTMLAMR